MTYTARVNFQKDGVDVKLTHDNGMVLLWTKLAVEAYDALENAILHVNGYDE
jgi:hypothetical protein